MEYLLELDEELPVTLLQVFPEVVLHSVNGLSADLKEMGIREGDRR